MKLYVFVIFVATLVVLNGAMDVDGGPAQSRQQSEEDEPFESPQCTCASARSCPRTDQDLADDALGCGAPDCVRRPSSDLRFRSETLQQYEESEEETEVEADKRYMDELQADKKLSFRGRYIKGQGIVTNIAYVLCKAYFLKIPAVRVHEETAAQSVARSLHNRRWLATGNARNGKTEMKPIQPLRVHTKYVY
jgi:hypothetical protein